MRTAEGAPHGGSPPEAATALAAALALAGSLSAAPAAAQGFRGDGVTTFRYVELRPMVQDTVNRSRVTEGPGGRLTFDGIPVTCDPRGRCSYFHSPSTESATTLVQDVSLTSWGFGVRGLSATVDFRVREEVGGDIVWPRADDPFDLLEGYLQLNRDVFRLRLGRQRARTGLGFDSYDGLSAMVEPEPWFRAEVYGGRSLAEGVNEPHSDALRNVEDFLKDRNAYLVGASAGLEPEATTSLTVRYQREIWDDRAALLSERASADVETGVLRPVRLTGALDYDFALGRIGKAHLTAQLPLLDGDLSVEASGRRYVPYFDLWTIWGLFDPVPYHEARLRLTWSPVGRLGVWGEGSYRAYDDTDTSPILGPLEDDAYRVGVGARWNPRDGLDVTGSYRVEGNAGAFLSSGRVSARWQAHRRVDVSVHGMMAQQIEEFRIGEGMVAGGGLSGSVDLWEGLRFSGGAALYRRFFENRPSQVDWNQVRAWTSLRVPLGGDPGTVGSER